MMGGSGGFGSSSGYNANTSYGGSYNQGYGGMSQQGSTMNYQQSTVNPGYQPSGNYGNTGYNQGSAINNLSGSNYSQSY